MMECVEGKVGGFILVLLEIDDDFFYVFVFCFGDEFLDCVVEIFGFFGELFEGWDGKNFNVILEVVGDYFIVRNSEKWLCNFGFWECFVIFF